MPAVFHSRVPRVLDHRASGEPTRGHFRRQLTSGAHNDAAVLGTTNYLETRESSLGAKTLGSSDLWILVDFV